VEDEKCRDSLQNHEVDRRIILKCLLRVGYEYARLDHLFPDKAQWQVLVKTENRDSAGLNTDVSLNILFEICEEEVSHITLNIIIEFLFWPPECIKGLFSFP
jgi:hypothetical protein